MTGCSEAGNDHYQQDGEQPLTARRHITEEGLWLDEQPEGLGDDVAAGWCYGQRQWGRHRLDLCCHVCPLEIAYEHKIKTDVFRRCSEDVGEF